MNKKFSRLLEPNLKLYFLCMLLFSVAAVPFKPMPILRDINPKAAQNMARAAGLLAAEDAALDALAEELLVRAEESQGRASLKWAALRSVSEAIRGRAILGLMERACGHRRDLSAAHDLCPSRLR